MSVDKIPKHFFIPLPFLYQADYQLRSGGAGDVEASFQGRTQALVKKMVADGWRKVVAEYENEKGEVVRKSANQAILYHPDHYEPDPGYNVPVKPKTQEAEDFVEAVTPGSRMNFSVKDPETGRVIKNEIMDLLVQELSGGRVQHFSLSARARERMQSGEVKPPDRFQQALSGPPQPGKAPQAQGRPAATPRTIQGMDPWVPVPDAVVRSVGKQVDPEQGAEAVRSVLHAAGYENAKKSGKEYWFHPKHWEPAVGGIGVLPLTDEAEMFQEQIGEDAVQGLLPRQVVPKVTEALRNAVKAMKGA